MEYMSRRMICGDCMEAFEYTVEEQQTDAFAGVSHAPTRCPQCRSSRETLMATKKARDAGEIAPARRRH